MGKEEVRDVVVRRQISLPVDEYCILDVLLAFVTEVATKCTSRQITHQYLFLKSCLFWF
jgi:hypothetical protein